MLIFFATRQKARDFAAKLGKTPIDCEKKQIPTNGKRWAVCAKKA